VFREESLAREGTLSDLRVGDEHLPHTATGETNLLRAEGTLLALLKVFPIFFGKKSVVFIVTTPVILWSQFSQLLDAHSVGL
jgi:hypothetical protein